MTRVIRCSLAIVNIVFAFFQVHKSVVVLLIPKSHKLSDDVINLAAYFLLTTIAVITMLPEIKTHLYGLKKDDINVALSFSIAGLVCASFITIVLNLVGFPSNNINGMFSAVSAINGLIFAPIYEELICRLVIQSSLSRIHNTWAIVITAIVFCLLHFANKENISIESVLPSFGAYIVLGVVCGVSFWKQKNVIVTILIHVFWNVFVILSKLIFCFVV